MISECGADDDPDAMYALLGEAGCLVVRDMASSDDIAAVRAEFAGHLSTSSVDADDPDDFYPGNTHRVVSLMHRSACPPWL